MTKELRKLGHEAYSCDLQESSGGHPEWHLQMDVFEAIELKPSELNQYERKILDSLLNIK